MYDFFSSRTKSVPRQTKLPTLADRQTAWTNNALAAVKNATLGSDKITTDDVWKLLDDEAPTDNRRMGAVMRRAQSEGIITPTFAFRRSTRSVCNGRPVRVWKKVIA